MFNKYNLKYCSKIFGVFIFLLISSFILISCSDNDLKNLTSRSQGFINSWQNGNMEEIYTKYISYRMKEKCDLDNFVNINNNELENWKRNSDFVNWDKDVSITIDRIKIVKPTSQKEKEKIEQGEKLLGIYKSVNHGKRSAYHQRANIVFVKNVLINGYIKVNLYHTSILVILRYIGGLLIEVVIRIGILKVLKSLNLSRKL